MAQVSGRFLPAEPFHAVPETCLGLFGGIYAMQAVGDSADLQGIAIDCCGKPVLRVSGTNAYTKDHHQYETEEMH